MKPRPETDAAAFASADDSSSSSEGYAKGLSSARQTHAHALTQTYTRLGQVSQRRWAHAEVHQHQQSSASIRAEVEVKHRVSSTLSLPTLRLCCCASTLSLCFCCHLLSALQHFTLCSLSLSWAQLLSPEVVVAASIGRRASLRVSGIGWALIPAAVLGADLVLNCCAATAYVDADCSTCDVQSCMWSCCVCFVMLPVCVCMGSDCVRVSDGGVS